MVHGAGAAAGALSTQVGNLLAWTWWKRRIQTIQLIVPHWVPRSRQERVDSVGNEKHRIARHRARQTCSYVTRGARRALPSMPSLTAFVMQGGVRSCCYCRCAAAVVGHCQYHGAFRVPHSLLVAAGSVAASATPGPACSPSPPSPVPENPSNIDG